MRSISIARYEEQDGIPPSHTNHGNENGYRSIVGTPKIICLCGSTKFREAFHDANAKLTGEGNIVLSVGFFGHRELNAEYMASPEWPARKAALDQLHMRKIDLADEIFVINVGDYVGDSTWNEIEYAHKTGKPIRWLEETAHTPGAGRNTKCVKMKPEDKIPPEQRRCRDCDYCGMDMDLEPYCVEPSVKKGNPIGLNVNRAVTSYCTKDRLLFKIRQPR